MANRILVTRSTDIEGAPGAEINNTSVFRFVGDKFKQALDSVVVPLCGKVNQIVTSLHHHVVLLIGRGWNNIGRAVFGEQVVLMMPHSTLTFIVTALLAFAEIKSQGNADFPFESHSQATMVSITSVVAYGFASLAEVVVVAAGFDHASVYAIIARLGRVASLSVLVASLATLLYY